MKRFRLSGLVLLCVLAAAMACSKSDPVVPGIQPEVINSTDNFQFQVTSMKNYTGTLQYVWDNTGTMAKANHSCAMTGGGATLVLVDAATSQVYGESLAQNGDFFSSAGTSGSWKIRVVCTKASGTINFRVDKFTP